MLEALLAKQQTQCALALKELNEAGRKLTHWTWWVFPTDHPGASEPPPRTAITAATAGVLLDRAPRLWRKCLGKVRALLKAPGPDTGTLAKVFPPEDWDRIKRFVRFWGRVAKAPPWLKTVLRDLGAAASAAEPGAPRGSTAWPRRTALDRRPGAEAGRSPRPQRRSPARQSLRPGTSRVRRSASAPNGAGRRDLCRSRRPGWNRGAGE